MEKYPRNKNGEQVNDQYQPEIDSKFNQYVQAAYEKHEFTRPVHELSAEDDKLRGEITRYVIADSFVMETYLEDGSLRTLLAAKDGKTGVEFVDDVDQGKFIRVKETANGPTVITRIEPDGTVTTESRGGLEPEQTEE